LKVYRVAALNGLKYSKLVSIIFYIYAIKKYRSTMVKKNRRVRRQQGLVLPRNTTRLLVVMLQTFGNIVITKVNSLAR